MDQPKVARQTDCRPIMARQMDNWDPPRLARQTDPSHRACQSDLPEMMAQTAPSKPARQARMFQEEDKPHNGSLPQQNKRKRDDLFSISAMNMVRAVDREQMLRGPQDISESMRLPTLEKKDPSTFQQRQSDFQIPHNRLASFDDTVNWQGQADNQPSRFVAKIDGYDMQAVLRLAHSLHLWAQCSPGRTLNIFADKLSGHDTRAEFQELIEDYKTSLLEDERPAKRYRDETQVSVRQRQPPSPQQDTEQKRRAPSRPERDTEQERRGRSRQQNTKQKRRARSRQRDTKQKRRAPSRQRDTEQERRGRSRQQDTAGSSHPNRRPRSTGAYHDPDGDQQLRVCANCEVPGHALKDCALGNIHTGAIPGCPVCNVPSGRTDWTHEQGHHFDDCPKWKRPAHSEEEGKIGDYIHDDRFHFLVKGRARKPAIRSVKHFYLDVFFENAYKMPQSMADLPASDMFPWTDRFAMERSGFQHKDNVGLEDPFWAGKTVAQVWHEYAKDSRSFDHLRYVTRSEAKRRRSNGRFPGPPY
ncbi:hypothetical protein QBC39DRAFT_415138 [Podospora conica]|nr:hypothetical protein QBC39DRAFT_415138 [Schizothecium conicum]